MFEPDFVTLDTDDIVISACQALNADEGLCGYYLRIENNSGDKIQILGKDFQLTDDKGNNYLQSGVGFKGEIPELNPGEYFEFEDIMPLCSNAAVLYGTCRIVQDRFHRVKNVRIPALQLFVNKQKEFVVN